MYVHMSVREFLLGSRMAPSNTICSETRSSAECKANTTSCHKTIIGNLLFERGTYQKYLFTTILCLRHKIRNAIIYVNLKAKYIQPYITYFIEIYTF